MKNQVQKGRFQFSLKLALFVIIMLPILISLGIWQLDRADEKLLMQAKIDRQFARAPMDICEITQAQQTKEFLQYLPVKLNVEMTEKYFLVDNQVHKGKVGYEVIQLVQACEREYLVSRGFVKGNPDRRILPSIESYVAEMKQLEGYFYLPIDNKFIRDELYPEATIWPLRISQINFNAIADYIHDELELFPAIIRLNPEEEIMFDAHWTLLSTKPAKHYAYAIQWFGLAITLLGMFLYASCIKRNAI